MTKDTVGDLLRAIGQNPTQAEVADIEDGLPSDVDFETFKKVVQRPDGFRPPADPEDLVRGFQIFDKDGTGYIGVGELKYGQSRGSRLSSSTDFSTVLTSLGERMSTEDVEELLKGVDIKNDSVNYSGEQTLKSNDQH